MDALEKASRLSTRVLNEHRLKTQDWLDRVQQYCDGIIRDDRITCSECKNNKGRCVSPGKGGFYALNLKQRCFKYLKL